MRLLDLFCGAGGAAMGYYRAGFDQILGVDIEPQPNYPFPFYQSDVFDLKWTLDHLDFDFIHASPPCQAYSKTRFMRPSLEFPDLIPQTRELLEKTGLPYIIENVPGAPIRHDLMLCGGMFDLPLIRHRYFESTLPLESLPHKKHNYKFYTVFGHNHGMATYRRVLGIDWMKTPHELSEAIPPAYTEEIGHQILVLLGGRVAA